MLNAAALPRLRISAGTVVASPCIIQCQAPLHSHILVIPLLGLSLWSPWQLFPLPLASLGPSLAHMHLSCSSPNTAINSCCVTIFRRLVPSVLFVSETNVFKVPLASAGCVAAFRVASSAEVSGEARSLLTMLLWTEVLVGAGYVPQPLHWLCASSTSALPTAFVGNEQGEVLWRPLVGVQHHWHQFE